MKIIQRIKIFLMVVWRYPESKSGMPKEYQMNRIDARTAWDVARIVVEGKI